MLKTNRRERERGRGLFPRLFDPPLRTPPSEGTPHAHPAPGPRPARLPAPASPSLRPLLLHPTAPAAPRSERQSRPTPSGAAAFLEPHQLALFFYSQRTHPVEPPHPLTDRGESNGSRAPPEATARATDRQTDGRTDTPGGRRRKDRTLNGPRKRAAGGISSRTRSRDLPTHCASLSRGPDACRRVPPLACRRRPARQPPSRFFPEKPRATPSGPPPPDRGGGGEAGGPLAGRGEGLPGGGGRPPLRGTHPLPIYIQNRTVVDACVLIRGVKQHISALRYELGKPNPPGIR